MPYATVMRWRHRQRQRVPLCQCPGPKKTAALDWPEFFTCLRQLAPGPTRTHGTGELYALVQDLRWEQRHTMKRIHWLKPGVAWSCDATTYGDQQLIPVQDLASRYRFPPLVLEHLDGLRIAAHLEALFRKHGPPLFLKRDNGSPFNCQPVEDVLARFGVLPLNNPPHFPRYHGAMEKSIRDFKAALDQRHQRHVAGPNDFVLAVELTAHELNHQPRRCLNGRTACAVFHDEAQRRRWPQRERHTIFRLLRQKFGEIVGDMPKDDHPLRHAVAWRVTVEHWLRCQNLIAVRQNQKPKVSPHFPQNWSHN